MKKIVALILALVMVFALCACGGKAEPADSNKLILGTSADYSPFEFMYPDDKGELQYAGIDVSVAQYIADHTGKELQIENMAFDYLLASLQKGEFDMVIAAMEATEERLAAADFSDPYYGDEDAKILVRAEDAELYKSLSDFDGKVVAAQNGTTKMDIVTNHLPGAELVAIGLVTDMVNELVNNKVDAIIVDGGVAISQAESNSDLVIADASAEISEVVETLPFCVAVQKGDPKGLLPGINEAIANMLEEGVIADFEAEAKAQVDSGLAQDVSAEAPAE